MIGYYLLAIIATAHLEDQTDFQSNSFLGTLDR